MIFLILYKFHDEHFNFHFKTFIPPVSLSSADDSEGSTHRTTQIEDVLS